MAAPTFIAASTGATDATGGWTATCHAPGAAGRIIIFQLLQDGTGAASTITSTTNIEDLAGTDGAWTVVGTGAVGSAAVANQRLWIGRSLSTSAPVITGANSSGDDGYWRFYEFSDVSTGTTLATVIENVTAGSIVTGAATSGTIADASVTTLGPDRLPLQFVAINDDNAMASFTGETGGNWQEAVAEYADSAGTDGAIGLQLGLPAWTSNTQGSSGFGSVAFGNGYWVAVGDTGTLYYKTSPDGAWTSNTQGAGTLNGVAFGNGYWVAVGVTGTLYYKADTPDGAWTSNTQGALNLQGVVYDNGYWVAVGSTGTLYYKADTPDGAWTSNTQGATTFWSVAFGNGYWVAVGSTGTLYYKATDPTGAWTSNTQGALALFAVAFGNGYWVAVGDGGTLYYKADTPDGAWTSNTQGTIRFESVAFGNGYWVAVGSGAGTLYFKASTPDGVWTSSPQGTLGFFDVVCDSGYWVTVGASGGLWYNASDPPALPATTIDGGTATNPDATDGWGVIGFALIGTTITRVPRFRPYPQLLAH